jgi:hypothetical protein
LSETEKNCFDFVNSLNFNTSNLYSINGHASRHKSQAIVDNFIGNIIGGMDRPR